MTNFCLFPSRICLQFSARVSNILKPKRLPNTNYSSSAKNQNSGLTRIFYEFASHALARQVFTKYFSSIANRKNDLQNVYQHRLENRVAKFKKKLRHIFCQYVLKHTNNQSRVATHDINYFLRILSAQYLLPPVKIFKIFTN